MYEEQNERPQQTQRPPVRRKRRKKTKWQIFKEAYLPLLILLLGFILVIMLLVGLVKLIFSDKKPDTTETTEGTATSQTTLPAEPQGAAAEVLSQAAAKAAGYDYEGAIALLEAYTGKDEQVAAQLDTYKATLDALVPWQDSTVVTQLSFQPIVADPARAFDGDDQADFYYRNNLTVKEFKTVLEQLYAKGYVLVSQKQMAAADESGKFVAGSIRLPEGKKPLVMSQVPSHYLKEQAKDGFADRLVVNENGAITCEYTDAEGVKSQGAYDFVSILEEFISLHPDFSYRGARAILTFSGAKDPLGYDLTNTEEAAQAKVVTEALRKAGYVFASFTYGEIPYVDSSAEEIKKDVQSWKETYDELLGPVDILIYAGGSELEEYAGEKFDVLMEAGFRYFCGMNNSDPAWGKMGDNYLRQDRRTITGARIMEQGDMVADLFDASSIMSDPRS